MRIELVHFYCNDCGVYMSMDKKTAEKINKKSGRLRCTSCYKKMLIREEIENDPNHDHS